MQEVQKIINFSTLLALFNNILNSLQRYDGVTERFCVSANITSKFRTVAIFESFIKQSDSNKTCSASAIFCCSRLRVS
jgi:hypothetical protein